MKKLQEDIDDLSLVMGVIGVAVWTAGASIIFVGYGNRLAFALGLVMLGAGLATIISGVSAGLLLPSDRKPSDSISSNLEQLEAERAKAREVVAQMEEKKRELRKAGVPVPKEVEQRIKQAQEIADSLHLQFVHFKQQAAIEDVDELARQLDGTTTLLRPAAGPDSAQDQSMRLGRPVE